MGKLGANKIPKVGAKAKAKASPSHGEILVPAPDPVAAPAPEDSLQNFDPWAGGTLPPPAPDPDPAPAPDPEEEEEPNLWAAYRPTTKSQELVVRILCLPHQLSGASSSSGPCGPPPPPPGPPPD